MDLKLSGSTICGLNLIYQIRRRWEWSISNLYEQVFVVPLSASIHRSK